MLALLSTLPSWVLFSPVVRTLTYPAYENAQHIPWTGPSSFNLEIVSVRWSLPPDAYSDVALSSGISYALHRDFCARLLPLFPEDASLVPGQTSTMFLNCNDLRDTIRRGMDTWAINHKKINFVDVTDACRDVASVESCPAAELFIVADSIDRSDSDSNDLAAEVRHRLTNIDYNPYSTAGKRLNPGLGVTSSLLVVRAPSRTSTFCWYLDSTFCYQFHRWQYADVDVIMIGRIACAGVFGFALIVVFWVIASMIYAVCCARGAPDMTQTAQGQSVVEGIGGARSPSVVNLNQALKKAGVSAKALLLYKRRRVPKGCGRAGPTHDIVQ